MRFCWQFFFSIFVKNRFFFLNKKYPMLLLIPPRVCVQSFMMLDGVKVARLWDFVDKNFLQFSLKIYIFFKNKKYPMLLLIPPRVCVQSFMMIGWVVFAWWCNKQTDFRIYNISKISIPPFLEIRAFLKLILSTKKFEKKKWKWIKIFQMV